MFVIAGKKLVYFLHAVFFGKVVPLKYNAQISFRKVYIKENLPF